MRSREQEEEEQMERGGGWQEVELVRGRGLGYVRGPTRERSDGRKDGVGRKGGM